MQMHNKDIVIDTTLEPRKLLAKNGLQWIRAAFRQFTSFSLTWITIVVVYFIIGVLLNQHTLLHYLSLLVMPILQGGIFIAAATGDKGIAPRIEQLFYAFKTDGVRLMMSGAMWGLFSMLLTKLVFIILLPEGSDSNLILEQLDDQIFVNHITSLSLLPLLALMGLLGIFFYLSTAYLLVSALIIFNHLTPIMAFRFALSGCLHNWRAILLYMLSIFCLAIIASIPLFLGWFILLPVIMISNFYMWKSIFTYPIEEESAPLNLPYSK